MMLQLASRVARTVGVARGWATRGWRATGWGESVCRRGLSGGAVRWFSGSSNEPSEETNDPPVHSRLPPADVESQEEAYGISWQSVVGAYKRMRDEIDTTALGRSRSLSKLCGCELYLKKEHISITGSYKERGALNAMLHMSEEQRQRGVICSSAGNHAQAVSYHSTRLGIRGKIVMPVNTPYNKVRRTRDFGAEVVQAGNSFHEAFVHAQRIAEEENLEFIHAYNNRHVVAGQGTVGMEIYRQNPLIDTVIVPIGGGGLIAGMALFLKTVNPRIKVYGVETEAMPGMRKSWTQHHVVTVPKVPTMADGIAIETVGDIPLRIIEDLVDDIFLVDEDELAESVNLLLENEKTVVEASGAAGLAALIQAKDKMNLTKDSSVAVVLSGGNIDMSLLCRIIEKGLVKSGRMCRIMVNIQDIPGQLAQITRIVSDMGANIRDIEHERAFLSQSPLITMPKLTLETRGFSHVHEIVKALQDAGLQDVTLETPTWQD